MSAITVVDNEYATLLYYPEKGIVHHIFHRPVSGEEFRSILNKGVEIFKEHGATKWLSDDRKISALSPDDSEWAKTDWHPRVIKAGWKYWALVVPDDVLVKMNLVQFTETYSALGLRVMVFSSDEKAMAWLEKR